MTGDFETVAVARESSSGEWLGCHRSKAESHANSRQIPLKGLRLPAADGAVANKHGMSASSTCSIRGAAVRTTEGGQALGRSTQG